MVADELGRGRDAVPVGEVHVHEHDVRVQPGDGGERLGRVLGVADALQVGLGVQRPGEQLGERPVVVDDEHPGAFPGTIGLLVGHAVWRLR